MKFSKKSPKKKVALELTDEYGRIRVKRTLQLSSRYLNLFLLSLELPRKDSKKDVFLNKNPEYSEYSMGRFSYGHPIVLNYNSSRKVIIGNFCSIANGVTILTGGEHMIHWITTYPFNTLFKKFQHIKNNITEGDVIIGNDVWIGLNATILPGVKINDGAVVGANSVVTKDVPPYAIVAGNPAKLIRMRFDRETIDSLLRIKWWNWDIQRIMDNMPLLLSNNVEEFVKKNTIADSAES
jgi:acetyltransferase-like isoleucine patch superfamily enzyme